MPTHFRFWCFTLHEPGDQFSLEDKLAERKAMIRYAVWQVEACPKTGKIHLQGYVELVRGQRMTWLKKIHPKIHLEVRKGTQKQAIDYCKKSRTQIEGTY